MAKVNVTNFKFMNETEKNYARKRVDMFIGKVGGYIPEISVMDVSLSEVRRKEEHRKSRFDIRMESSYGVYQAHAEGWNKVKTLIEALNKLERQIRKDRKKINK